MSTIHRQFSGTSTSTTAQAQFSGRTKVSSQEAACTRSPEDKFIQGSVGEGVKRVFKMAFLRPRGWIETIAHFFGGITLVIPAKHFLEGLIGADSLFIPRKIRITNLSDAVSHNGRTIVDAIKDYVATKQKAKA